ncbi:hypothetical protein JG687_00011366, partial [Phytophthora cactorum]
MARELLRSEAHELQELQDKIHMMAEALNDLVYAREELEAMLLREAEVINELTASSGSAGPGNGGGDQATSAGTGEARVTDNADNTEATRVRDTTVRKGDQQASKGGNVLVGGGVPATTASSATSAALHYALVIRERIAGIARHLASPNHPSGGSMFVVGVPAHAAAYRSGKCIEEGYAGIRSLVIFDGLSAQDFDDLTSLVSHPSKLYEKRLRPWPDWGSPTLSEIELMLNSVMLRRQAASVFTKFPLDRFAEKLFYTISLLNRVLARDRQPAAPNQISDEYSDQALNKLRRKCDEFKRDHPFLELFYAKEIAEHQAVNDKLM